MNCPLELRYFVRFGFVGVLDQADLCSFYGHDVIGHPSEAVQVSTNLERASFA